MANKFKHIQEVPNTVDHSTRVFLTSLRNAVRQIAVVVEDQAAATTATTATVNTSPQVPSATNPGVTNLTGLLTLHAVLLGNDGTDIRAMAGVGADGQYLRSYGAGNDPNWAGIVEAEVTGLVADLASKALATRLIGTTAPLTGGGDLTADRTLAVSIATGGAVGVVKVDGTTIAVAGDGTLSTIGGGGAGTVTHVSSALTTSAVILGNGGADIKPIGSLGMAAQYLRSGGAGVDPAFAAITEAEVTNLTTDLALKAPLASPALTGVPTAPTPLTADNSTTIATTAFVKAQVAPVISVAGKTGAVTLVEGDITNLTADLAAKAPLASPALTGTPTAPTPTTGDDSTQIATTAFVEDTIDNLVAGDIPNIAESQVTGLVADLALKAPLASPALTGTPTAPTAAGATNTTQVATTAFVEQEIATASGVSGTANFFAHGGDGSDSALHYDGVATILGMAPVANVYTLTRDIWASSITIDISVTVITNNFGIFCTGTLNNAGIINNDGATGSAGGSAASNAGGSAGGATTAPGVSTGRYPRLGASVAGIIGGAGGTTTGTQAGAASLGTNASAGIDSTGISGNTGASGGLGGTGTSGAGGAVRAGGAAGTVSGVAGSGGRQPDAAWQGIFCVASTLINAAYTPSNSGSGGVSGGGGGGGDTTNAGGGGGGGGAVGADGGLMGIFAFTIINSGTIRSNGGTGGVGGNGRTQTVGNVGGGGGGAGGSGGRGGIIWLVYHKLTNTGTISANGGGGGNGGSKGSPHGTGTDNATAGGNGAAGKNGNVIQIQS